MKKTIKISKFEWNLRWVLFYIVSAIDFVYRLVGTVATYTIKYALILSLGVGFIVALHLIPELLTNIILGWF